MLRFFSYFFAGNALVFLSFVPLFAYSSVTSGLSVMKKHIISYNLMHHKRVLANGSYRGEEGILVLRPEAGRLFGLKVLMNEDFFRAKDQFDKASGSFEKAVEAMTTVKKERSPGEHSRRVYESSLAYKRFLDSARGAMKSYRAAIDAGNRQQA